MDNHLTRQKTKFEGKHILIKISNDPFPFFCSQRARERERESYPIVREKRRQREQLRINV